ncbi:MAG: TraR/DksA C4-type zinc finger protein [Proteobacteria bacterium]|nr:TraR/DksA C4-type zinc finger protein [Pseudomonadota bacterium]
MMAILDCKQLDPLKDRLRQRRQQLLEDLKTQLRESGDKNFIALAGQVHDAGEESVADMLGALSAIAAEQETRELREVESALLRIQQDNYGICAACGEAIPVARLQANPAATCCVACQKKSEGPEGGRDRTPTL